MKKTIMSKLRILFLLALFMAMISMTPSLVQAYDNPDYTISEIQGDGFVNTIPSGMYIDTYGIVTADYQDEVENGFYVQDPIGDGNPDTSDGIFVYHYYDVNVGDEVKLQGKVSEYYGMTQMYRPYITILSSGNPIPDPVELNPPCDDYASDVYYESLEGMLVSVSSMKVVSGTNTYYEYAGVVEDLDIERVFVDDSAGTGELIFVDDSGGNRLSVQSGWVVKGLYGPLDYSFEEYKILPARNYELEVVVHGNILNPAKDYKGLTIATYNMYNFFEDYYVATDFDKHAHAIHDFLGEPDIIAVQEVEKIELLQQLAATWPIEAEYEAILIEGPDARGIDVGLLYRTDRVSQVNYAEARQYHTYLDDGYGPGTDPNYECPDGANPLFSRPPLVVNLEIVGKKGTTSDLWLIINHFKSKGEYEPYYADPEPRRIEQAMWVSSLMNQIEDDHLGARIVVLGDLNDFIESATLATLRAAGLYHLNNEVEKENRYTYIYLGVSECLDHILINSALASYFDDAMVIHFNPDFPYRQYVYDRSTGIRSSDHDVLMCVLDL
ncbi:MAG: endonuclease/exonuclease/phosphatase family protein [Candidatus Thorarchaeota archaeon]